MEGKAENFMLTVLSTAACPTLKFSKRGKQDFVLQATRQIELADMYES
jgi:hypothetical protein